MGYQAAFASLCFLCSGLIHEFIAIVHSMTSNTAFVPDGWQKTLLIIGVSSLATVVNIWFSDGLAAIESIILCLHILGLFAIIIPLWVMGDAKPGREVFQTFTNDAGWPTMTMACLVGQLGALYSFTGVDCATHMCMFLQCEVRGYLTN